MARCRKPSEKMPFPRVVGAVSMTFQQRRQPGFIHRLKVAVLIVHAHYLIGQNLVRIKTRKKAGPGGPAPACIIKVGEPESVFCQGINMGSLNDLCPVTSQVGVSQIIGQDKYNIGWGIRRCIASRYNECSQATEKKVFYFHL